MTLYYHMLHTPCISGLLTKTLLSALHSARKRKQKDGLDMADRNQIIT